MTELQQLAEAITMLKTNNASQMVTNSNSRAIRSLLEVNSLRPHDIEEFIEMITPEPNDTEVVKEQKKIIIGAISIYAYHSNLCMYINEAVEKQKYELASMFVGKNPSYVFPASRMYGPVENWITFFSDYCPRLAPDNLYRKINEKKMVDLQAKYDELEKKCEQLSADQESSEVARATLTEQSILDKKSIETLTIDSQNYKNNYDNMVMSHNKSALEICKLKSDAQKHEALRAEMALEYNKLNKDNVELRATIETLQTENANLRAKKDTLTADYYDLQKQNCVLDAENAKHKKEILGAKATLDTCFQSLAFLTSIKN